MNRWMASVLGAAALSACANSAVTQLPPVEPEESGATGAFVITRDRNGACYWIFRTAGNNKTLFKSQSYKTDSACRAGLETLRIQLQNATIKDRL